MDIFLEDIFFPERFGPAPDALGIQFQDGEAAAQQLLDRFAFIGRIDCPVCPAAVWAYRSVLVLQR
jgi:hypothetical protein